MRRIIRWIAAAIAIGFTLSLCVGNTGCQQGAGTASGGSSGNGGNLIAIGNVPVPIARPYGIKVGGARTGQTVWILTGGALGALAAAEAHAANMVGGTANTLPTTGDPCHGKTTKTKLVAWKKGPPGTRGSFMDCAGLQKFRNKYKDISTRNLQTVFRCIQRALVFGTRTVGSSFVTWVYVSGEHGDTTTTIETDRSGRVTDATSDSWMRCGVV
jgi:hypothetical protein